MCKTGSSQMLVAKQRKLVHGLGGGGGGVQSWFCVTVLETFFLLGMAE